MKTTSITNFHTFVTDYQSSVTKENGLISIQDLKLILEKDLKNSGERFFHTY